MYWVFSVFGDGQEQCKWTKKEFFFFVNLKKDSMNDHILYDVLEFNKQIKMYEQMR